MESKEVLAAARLTYPYPIASAVRQFEFEADPWRRYDRLVDAAEAIIIWLGVLSLAWASQSDKRELVDADWREAVRTGGVTLGTWFNVVCLAQREMSRLGEDFGGFATALRTHRRNEGPRGALEGFVAERNRRAHGRAPRSEHEAAIRLSEFEDGFLEVVQALQVLSELKWFAPSRIEYKLPDRVFEISAVSITGDHPIFQPIELFTSEPLGNELYVEDDDGRRLLLVPFAALSDCSECLRQELFYPSRLVGGELELLAFGSGHKLLDKSLATLMDDATALGAFDDWHSPTGVTATSYTFLERHSTLDSTALEREACPHAG